MRNLKRYFFLLLILSTAFAWGYKRDAILEKIDSFQEDTKDITETALQPKTLAPDERLPPPALTTPSSKPRPASPPSGIEQNNPYQRFMTKPTRARNTASSSGSTLAGTLDSIRRDGIEDQQIIRRNAYFEKLSQQLKELKGETPSEEPVANPLNEATADDTAPPSPLSAPPETPRALPERFLPVQESENMADEFSEIDEMDNTDSLESERQNLEEELDRLEADILQ